MVILGHRSDARSGRQWEVEFVEPLGAAGFAGFRAFEEGAAGLVEG
ncbi:hypothetical protein [Streptomyces cinnamoneus]|nr:hypothetical protein [Streptomyces cinnamoneus]